MVKWWWCCLSTVTLSVLVLSGIIRVKAERRSRRPKEFPDANKNLPNFTLRSSGARPLSTTKNISRLLDNLLKGYDQKLRPSFGGEPTTVEIDIEVRSMSQISEMDMTYSMDCYFRQSWVDERLAFSDLDEAFTLSVAMLGKLWKPDTYIYNGKQSYVHLITTPNKFIRLYQNGRILYSSRLTINANCPMNLHHFPMDTQHCPLQLGSFAYTTREVVYKWNVERQVVIASDLMLSQFDLVAVPSGMENITRRAGEFSTLLASFYLQRHMGNFLIQVYGPCMLLVVLSWVSFWLNREATSDRISLGITTVLTMTFLGLEARKDLPKVSYSTALDLFVWLSYGFIFATIIEFAFVHIFTKVGSGEVYLSESSSEADSDEEQDEEDEDEADEDGEGVDGEEDEDDEPQTEPIGACTVASLTAHHSCHNQGGPNGVGSDSLPSHMPLGSTLPWTSSSPHPSIPSWTPPPPCAVRHWAHLPPCPSPPQPTFFIRLATFCSRRRRRYRSSSRRKRQSQESINQINQRPRRRRGTSAVSNRRSNRPQQMNSVSNIDEVSRVLFPLSFLCINLIYWYIYLSPSSWPEDHL
ncbi:gamma-aminobutyric acid receptor alpha-like isoform X1 [Macrobrachium rosenbergii]|uniref:gamma-aminobutyric acid receptor alpha-like isoform X1 n=1 Tax=Macrobrachium rosenbergii TaxID=79674 RepID=UPI0034D5E686